LWNKPYYNYTKTCDLSKVCEQQLLQGAVGHIQLLLSTKAVFQLLQDTAEKQPLWLMLFFPA